MAISIADLLRAFPELAVTGYRKTSEDTRDYNCLAWAAGETHRRWDPTVATDYWPIADRRLTVQTFLAAYATHDYQQCVTGDFEHGWEKIAIFAVSSIPTHAARQLGNGSWTSKLGNEIDIEHPTVEGVRSPSYGDVVAFMRRPIILQVGLLRQ